MDAMSTAEFLFQARRERRVIDQIPDDLRPRDGEEAYAVQTALVELLAQGGGGEPVGFKVGCTNAAAMELLGADGPFWGRLLRSTTVEDGARVSLPEAISIGIEPEYAYVVSEPLPPKVGGHDADSVLPFLGALMPSIEVVGSRYADFLGAGILSIVADNAANAAWVGGTAHSLEHGVGDLMEIAVEAYVDDVLAATGGAENVLGHPLNVVAWLANELAERGLQLQAGDYITTGTCTPLVPVEPGASVRCEFGRLGSVSVRVAG